MLLAINTTTQQFSLALFDTEGILQSEYVLPFASGSKFLMPALEVMMKNAGIKPEDLTSIAVAIGPGSFTGLKVGISVAKALSVCLNIPVVGISSLQALANQIPFSKIPITAMIDSRKGEYFVAQFIWKEGKLLQKGPNMCLKKEEFAERFTEETIFVGNDYLRQSKFLKDTLKDPLLAPSYLWHISASSVGMLALSRIKNRDYDDPFLLEPVYMRPPEIRHNPYGVFRC